jgi:group I intron endonuclease
MFIYKIENLINGKIYVGKTTKTIEMRFIQHCRDARYTQFKASRTYFHKAIAKHGESNFRVSLLEEVDDSLGDEREVFWIAELKADYNLTKGGHGGDTYASYNYQTWQKIKPSMKGENNPMYGKVSAMRGLKHKPETIQKMSDARSKFWTDEQRHINGKRMKGSLNHMSKSVTLDGIHYESMQEAQNKTGLSIYMIKKKGEFNG